MPQNNIKKNAVETLGYGFITGEHVPVGENEYYLRDTQNRTGINYRHLTAYEIEALVRNRNTSDDWNKILVSDAFNPELVKNCKFYGLVRIGKLEPYCLTFSDLKTPVGLYDSTIISCDFGDNVVIDNVDYLSHYIIGNEVIITNVNEIVTTNHTKFGVGIVKKGENESVRIWLEICNENGGRSVIPFNGMLAGDAYIWSKYRTDEALLEKFKQFTQEQFSDKRGYYGKIGDRTVIKNTNIIKDTWIGSDAYIKGANKIKNVTINSGPEGISQIGEGCEIVNGIIGFGCRLFYGVKAVRFIMANHSQLKYGARLINSYLGNNATISCCEVLNSLIFPAHEQHHNNSFLCAALVMGQSNIAAGATIGSNHNSRGADGEAIMGRGFWPGLCVSIKHNSKFASYTILAKGDYQTELNIPMPFSLVSNNESNNELTVMPAYWFLYNMYALARNSWKYIDRDKRVERIQHIEYEPLAPDTVNEMFTALDIIETFTGKAFNKVNNSEKIFTAEENKKIGKQLLKANNPIIDDLEILAEGFENSKRKAKLIKVRQAYLLYTKMIAYYGITQLIWLIEKNNIKSINQLIELLPNKTKQNEWLNIGGQLMPLKTINDLRARVKTNKIKSWEEVHEFYTIEGNKYPLQKMEHALYALGEIKNITLKKIDTNILTVLLKEVVETKEWITNNIYSSREKDYQNKFRQMVYDSTEEMEKVVGKLEENNFIQLQQKELVDFKKKVAAIKKILK
jgi:NDP-sugar pyrophosphorylase family protein